MMKEWFTQFRIKDAKSATHSPITTALPSGGGGLIEKMCKNIAGIYIVWILIHYLSPHLYVYFCVPATAMGFLTSAIYAPTPHCRALRWAIYQGGEMIMTMWIVAGSWVVKRLMLSNDEEKPTYSERKSPPIHM